MVSILKINYEFSEIFKAMLITTLILNTAKTQRRLMDVHLRSLDNFGILEEYSTFVRFLYFLN